MRDDDRALLRVLGRGLKRVLLRDECRALLRVPGQGLGRRLLRDEGRVLLRVLGQGLYRGKGLPGWSRGRKFTETKSKCRAQNAERKMAEADGNLGRKRSWDTMAWPENLGQSPACQEQAAIRYSPGFPSGECYVLGSWFL